MRKTTREHLSAALGAQPGSPPTAAEPAVLAAKPGDDQHTRSILQRARRLLATGDVGQSLQCLKEGADAALVCEDDRRALRLAGAAAELRAKREADSAQGAPASAVFAARETIEVDPSWLESAETAATDRGNDSRGFANKQACLGEAVRVWVGPNGELSLYTPGTRPQRGHIEALLVTQVSTARLAERVGLASRERVRAAGAAGGDPPRGSTTTHCLQAG